MDSKKQQREQWLFAVICIFGFALILRFFVGMGYVNTQDTYWYRRWAVDLPNGLFDVYNRADSISLDYPPLYLIPLYFIGLIYKSITVDAHEYIQMFVMKFLPIVFDCLCAVFIYRVCSREFGQKVAFIGAVAWLFNPSMFFNSTMWGQTDSIMAFLLLLAFWYAYKNKTVAACVLFAIAGLTKYQSLMFTPVFLLELFYKCEFKLKRILISLSAAAATVLIVFLPFMIGTGDPLLFFRVYLGGASTYPYCSLYCFNLYGLMGLDWSTGIKDTEMVISGLSYQTFGYIMVILGIAILVLMYVKGENRNPWVGGLFFMQWVFIFMTRMHERYQIIVLPFALMAYLITKKRTFGISYILLTVMTLINQAIVLMPYNYDTYPGWREYMSEIIVAMSFVNIVIFIWVSYICISHFFSPSKKSESDDAAGLSEINSKEVAE